jgi:hypothetical protein
MVTVYEIGVRTYDFFEDGEMRRAHGPDRARGCAGMPHHGTQRGNRREWVFFGAEDYQFYRRLIATAARRDGAEI